VATRVANDVPADNIELLALRNGLAGLLEEQCGRLSQRRRRRWSSWQASSMISSHGWTNWRAQPRLGSSALARQVRGSMSP